MIGTVLRVGFTNLRRDRVAQLLSFILPIVFFSIFAVIFGDQSNRTPHVAVAVVDEDGSELSRRLVAGLKSETSLRVRTTTRADKNAPEIPLDRDGARSLVRAGEVPVALIIPKGLGESGLRFAGGERAKVTMLADSSDPIAPQMVAGLLQKVAMTAAPDLMMGNGISMFEKYAGALTPGQRRAVDSWLPHLKERSAQPTSPPAAGGKGAPSGAVAGLIATEVVDVLRDGREKKTIVAFYAAGIGVMFLLFTCSGAGGALIEEQESGTLERLLLSRLGMARLLLGKWLYLLLLGALQLTVMFVWGALVFGLDLLGHLPGFVIVTVFTAGAAAGFGLLLAAACRTRAQLGGISTIVILVMSAIGGSMFPRFLMPESLQKVGLLTFNGWALDAYLKVFWREQPLPALAPQLAVLLALTLAFLAVTRLLARRWEHV
jgi:ABC-2 type transport system permease protein